MNKKTKLILKIVGVIAIVVVGGFYYNKSNEIKAFGENIKDTKESFSKLILNEELGEYKNIISQYDKALTNKNLREMKKLEKRLFELENRIVKQNEENINSKIEEINKFELLKDVKIVVDEKISNVKTLVVNRDFIKANEKITELKTYIGDNLVIEEEKDIEKMDSLEGQNIDNKEDKFDANKIKGRYFYEEKNPNGFTLNSLMIEVYEVNGDEINISGGHNSFQRAHLMIDGEFTEIDKNEVTNDMAEYRENDFDMLSRGGSIGGTLKYVGNNTFKGKIFDDQSGLGMEEKISCTLKMEGKDIIATLGQEAVYDGTYKLIRE